MTRSFTVELKECTYIFFEEIANHMSRPIEEILSDALYKCADIIMMKAAEAKDAIKE